MCVSPAIRKRGVGGRRESSTKSTSGFDAENSKTRRHQEGIITSSSVFPRQVDAGQTNIFIPMLFLPALADDAHLNHLLKWLAAVFYGFGTGRAPTTVNRQLGRASRDARPHVSISLQPSYQFFHNENRALWPSGKIVIALAAVGLQVLLRSKPQKTSPLLPDRGYRVVFQPTCMELD